MLLGAALDTDSTGDDVANRQRKRSTRQQPIVLLLGLILALALWTTDAVLDASTQPGDQIPAGFYFRIAVVAFVIGWALYSQRLANNQASTSLELKRERRQLALVYDNSPDAILIVSSDFTSRYANGRAAQLMGHPLESLLGKPCYAATGGNGPCDGCRVQAVLNSGNTSTALRRGSAPNGNDRWLEQTWYALPQEGEDTAVAEVSRDVTAEHRAEDALHQSNMNLESRVRQRTAALERANDVLSGEVTERRRMEKLLRESEERFRSIIELASDLILVHVDGIITFMNPFGASLLGYSNPADLVGLSVLDLISPDDKDTAAEELGKTHTLRVSTGPVELRFLRQNGKAVTLEVSAAPLTYHGRPAVQALGHDITKRKSAEKTIRHMAYYDLLTDLPNRALFDDRLHMEINRADREGTSFALMFVDMNDFKNINDTYGHHTGDDLLTEVGRRLVSATRKSDTVARFGGDEFTLLLPNESSRKSVAHIATKIIDAMQEPVPTSTTPIKARMSIGIAFYPYNGRTLGELTHAADMAMYQAKSAESEFLFAEAPLAD